MTELWAKWESLVIDGVFPLRRFLGRSDHSVVFLTEYKAQDFPNAAIKLVPADPAVAEAQISHWRMIAALSHPHLIRLLDAGRCQLGGHPFLFVVMEYAEQSLDQILSHRALTPDEVREMLPPTLDALAFLHRQNLAQGQLKPPNVLAVNDQLKLASDTIRATGESTASITRLSLYDPPEAKYGTISTAGDIWSLGMTIVEALTQRPPAQPDAESETYSLPESLPPAFVDTVQRCLSRNPANRPTAADLEAQIKAAPQAAVVPVPQPVLREAPDRATPAQKSPKRHLSVPAIAVVLIVLIAVWAGVRLFQSHPKSQPPVASSTSQDSSQQAASPSVVPKPSMSAPLSVLHQEIPDVPRSARESIRGHIKVSVRVTVDRAGNVVGVILENPGSSKYFARLATAAARKWKFSPADDQHSREWLLRFEFTRGGTTGYAAAPPP